MVVCALIMCLTQKYHDMELKLPDSNVCRIRAGEQLFRAVSKPLCVKGTSWFE